MRAFILVGPTATGKTAIAHLLALRRGRAVLSADSMLVYRGMDIGTAKPSRAQRAEVAYGGLDLVDPDAAFSTGAYLQAARRFLGDVTAASVIVTGGTGLYVRALVQGMDPMPSADTTIRAEAEAIWMRDGLKGLQDALRKVAPDRYQKLADPSNPRRLMRAYELSRMGVPMPSGWTGRPPVRLLGIRRESAPLRERIQRRVEEMYTEGLLEEVAFLRARYPVWSETALRAIGYTEAMACLDGRLSRADAMERTATRTRQLARRQMTWFRHQADVDWIDVEPDASPEAVADVVEKRWNESGPVPLAC